ncbi:DNA/RNA helicase domain-containing protein [Lentzea sp. JNUCC 0626]|uniref:DNA/RNA helicase domain-containing protein n=1 Tax=Lentzea sp. JNUCC 0626 TaxID=3367513 RepID=UPI0037498E52
MVILGEIVPLVRGSAAGLLSQARQGVLTSRLTKAQFDRFGYVSGEIQSWSESPRALLEAMVSAGLGESEVLLEYTLPRSSLRIDAVVCGTNPVTGRPSYVFVELKQWENVHSVVGGLVRLSAKDKLRSHPVDQIQGYCRYVRHSIPLIAEEEKLVSGLAFLHNAKRSHVELLLDRGQDHWGELYTREDLSDFERRLAELIDARRSHEDNEGVANRFLAFPVRPSAKFIEIAKEAVVNRRLFPLVDQQLTAYRRVENALVGADEHVRKTVVVVVGGPGSGKSAIALSLVGQFEALDLRGYHSTGSQSFTETLRRDLDPGNDNGVRAMFKYNNNFQTLNGRRIDIIVSDEAQRLRRSSTRSGSRGQNDDRPQIAEVINAARVPVFLLDENQRVRADEVGSVTEIRRVAEQLGCRVEVINLRGQFRYGGCEAFDGWVDRLLGIVDEPPLVWSEVNSPSGFQVHVGESPRDMENWMRDRKGPDQRARITAGFCWPWESRRDLENPEIVIDDWKRWWNFRERQPDGPKHVYWATDDGLRQQVGCVYTAQGFEYDWAAVIFGKDLVWRDGRWVAQLRESHDKKAKEIPALFPELVRNAYRVLLTRGLRGVTMFSVDQRTQEHLRAMVGPSAT